MGDLKEVTEERLGIASPAKEHMDNYEKMMEEATAPAKLCDVCRHADFCKYAERMEPIDYLKERLGVMESDLRKNFIINEPLNVSVDISCKYYGREG